MPGNCATFGAGFDRGGDGRPRPRPIGGARACAQPAPKSNKICKFRVTNSLLPRWQNAEPASTAPAPCVQAGAHQAHHRERGSPAGMSIHASHVLARTPAHCSPPLRRCADGARARLLHSPSARMLCTSRPPSTPLLRRITISCNCRTSFSCTAFCTTSPCTMSTHTTPPRARVH